MNIIRCNLKFTPSLSKYPKKVGLPSILIWATHFRAVLYQLTPLKIDCVEEQQNKLQKGKFKVHLIFFEPHP